MKARGRFDIVCVFRSGGYLRITSDKTRSLSPTEIVTCLRKYAGNIEAGIAAEAMAEGDNERASQPDDVRAT